MWKADQWKDYEVLDTSDGEKLERWGSFYLVRPDPQLCPLEHWRRALVCAPSAGALVHPLPRADVPGQAHELQAYGRVPGAGGKLGFYQ